jgi:LmbE family N-acetylglucosaminyl deacetylase
VIFTHGDGFPASAALHARKPPDRLVPADFKALAGFRQGQSVEALRALGGNPEDLVFLGYPDSGLDQVYLTRGSEPYRQRYTGQAETYAADRSDYHRSVHGVAAPYTYAAVLADVVELIGRLNPERICVTHEADRHPDHQAAFRFVRDGARACGFRGEIDTYLIHGGPGWPWPAGMTPGAPLEAHEANGVRIPQGVPWPPPRRVALDADDALAKRRAVEAQASHLVGTLDRALAEEKAYLESFVKGEEVFWPASRR